MIDINTWPLNAQIGFGLAPFVIALSGVAIDVHIACSRHFEVMCTALQNNRGLEQQIQLWGRRGVMSRTLVVASISGALAWPSTGIGRRVLEVEEIHELPTYLQRRMKVSCWLTLVGGIWLMIGAGLVQLGRY
ncbi:hypothetical protein [Pseudomonas]|uniref:Transmembrane protein n=1 Tax=Pseudomonas wadenswilerensis TaxID=1785161 RepID=A0A380SXQ4_9PSED|nr:hypothetical protein [Pseudomonas]UVM20296.1 hypothetical protein LOY45_17775 [Pseudomonas wadenswilerensis]SPO66063.1 conserved protein of unknown function [Pseudomonas sp. JV241A]SUQ62535.1 hypothetical protein CCOS864_01980 [Pseudomonas wadenswilerensis]